MLTTLILLTCAQAAPPVGEGAGKAQSGAAAQSTSGATGTAGAAPMVMAAPLVELGGWGGGCHTGCGSCATGICPGTMDPCPFEKKGLFARLRNAFRPKNKCVECLPPLARDKSQKLLFGRFHRPVNYCGAAGGTGCGGSGCGMGGCSTCELPPIPGSMSVVTPAPVPAPAPSPVPAPMPPKPEKPIAPPAGEGGAAKGKVNISIPVIPAIPTIPAPMPTPHGKPAF